MIGNKMARKRILITVKTYPALSEKYVELACTAGLLEDGSWIRLFPIPFRFLQDDKKYKKYQWIEANISKNISDTRPESFRVIDVDNINLLHSVGTERQWEDRKRIVFKKESAFESLVDLIKDAHDNKRSLATFKPAEILDFVHEKNEDDWSENRIRAAQSTLKQQNLFDGRDFEDFKVVRKLPYKFSYKFKDVDGKESKLMIEDWETSQLYWKCLKRYNSEKAALDKVYEKYYDDFALKKDLYFFLGTTFRWHKIGRNPYVIIGTFHPPHLTQFSFDL